MDTSQQPDKELIERRLEITDDPEHCIVHLINSGVTVTDGLATVEFASQGPVRRYKCHVDNVYKFKCKYRQWWAQFL